MTDPWEGKCCESCWNATGKRCECKCGGAHHGQGRHKPDETLDRYSNVVTKQQIVFCGRCGVALEVDKKTGEFVHPGGQRYAQRPDGKDDHHVLPVTKRRRKGMVI